MGRTGDRTQDNWSITSQRKLERFYETFEKKYGSIPSGSNASEAFRSWSVQPNAWSPIQELTFHKKSRFFPSKEDPEASGDGKQEEVGSNGNNVPLLPLINPFERTLQEIDEDLDQVFGPSPPPVFNDPLGPFNKAQKGPAEGSSSANLNSLAANRLRYTQESGILPDRRSSDYGPLNAPAAAPQGFKGQVGAVSTSMPPDIPPIPPLANPFHSRFDGVSGLHTQRPEPFARQVEERNLPLRRKPMPARPAMGTEVRRPQQSTAFPPSQPRATNVHPQNNNSQFDHNRNRPVLKVKNLPIAFGKHDLMRLFSQYGQVRWAFLQSEGRDLRKDRRYAKIGFVSRDEALLAQKNLDGCELFPGCRIQVVLMGPTNPAGPADATAGATAPRQAGAAPWRGANMPEPRVAPGYFPQKFLVHAAMDTVNAAAANRTVFRPLKPHLTEKTGAASWRK
ncbi:MAG: hypothetical protein Q9167_004615 [Letrouitia subvulpina]